MITTLAIANYRSIRELVMPLGRLNVVSGQNGTGKSNLYRALRLLAATAQGGVVAALAREGGMQSTLWAGPETISRAMLRGEQPVQGTVRQHPVALRLGFASDEFGYAIELGLRQAIDSMFTLDPDIKRESIWHGESPHPSSLLVDRRGAAVRARDDKGRWQSLPLPLRGFDSMLTEYADRRSTPEMLTVREQVRSWRFYDHFRTDADALARQPQVGTHTPVLSDDGRDLAAALQTIREIGDREALNECIDDAFPGSRIEIGAQDGRFELLLWQPGMLRPLRAAELSDGTLRYLLLAAALHTPRPPELPVLNEPETSLHADLLPALGRMIGKAAQRSQVIVVSHAARLIAALEQQPDSQSIVLEKQLGQTQVAGLSDLQRPAWSWLPR
ncbi:ATP-binding protein [Cupriavidus gilardii]|uniref:AAA family ATPase n=1 Tax=Cupriavidus gilardii TaxID=82541 RepID=UPI001EE4FB18|nr:AAA family ATPase [Cupriavidus gilardii]MCG5260307.1 AAA family ATPase [Cupriavidus gilardii]MDF9432385.1 ATP-binding protein [Cupriavidus gilardii]